MSNSNLSYTLNINLDDIKTLKCLHNKGVDDYLTECISSFRHEIEKDIEVRLEEEK